MPKKGKKGVRERQEKTVGHDVPEYASDDDQLYGNYDDPDPGSSEYFMDDVDKFHANRDKILIDKGYQEEEAGPLSDEEEVLDLDDEESDDEEIRNLKAQLRRVKQIQRKDELGSDIEDQSEDDEEGLPDNKAWGNRRSKYYGDDDIDLAELDEENTEAALEEQEALRLQRQMAEQLEDADFGLDIFKPLTDVTETTDTKEKIVKDLSKLSKKEKLKLLKKESPELLTLIDEFKQKMMEVRERLCPLRRLTETRNITGNAADYVHTKIKLILNYCTNIGFYLMLKCKQVPVHNHPVIKRLLQYRNILKQLEPLDIQMKDEIDDILLKLKNGEEIVLDLPAEKPKTFVRKRKTEKGSPVKGKKQKVSELVSDSDSGDSDDVDEDIGVKGSKKATPGDQYETNDEKVALEYYQMMKAGKPGNLGEEDEEMDGGDVIEGEGILEEDDLDGKRAISYQIEKNKGLTANKKKELRNPRVKHRMKYKKAKVRRKGQFREPRTEMQKYGGEISGIRAAVKRGIKLK